jgi:hypothetical protein
VEASVGVWTGEEDGVGGGRDGGGGNPHSPRQTISSLLLDS